MAAIPKGATSPDRLKYLDGWRGIAILMVLVSHFVGVTQIDIGRLGVDIFFVLSGMLMGNILFLKKTPLKPFFIRRVSRIMPLVLFYVIFWCALDFAFGLSHNQEYKNIGWILTFLRTYVTDGVSIWKSGIPVQHFWTLNVEEHAYIILGGVAAICSRSVTAGIIVLVLALLSIGFHLFYALVPEYAPFDWDLRTETIVVFIFLSAGYRLFRDQVEPYVPAFMPLITFALAVWTYTPESTWYLGPLCAPFLLAFTVNHLHSLPSFFIKVLEIRWLGCFGLWSFSIYIWQQPFFFYFIKVDKSWYEWGMVLAAASVLLGYLSFRFVETPARQYLVRRFAPR